MLRAIREFMEACRGGILLRFRAALVVYLFEAEPACRCSVNQCPGCSWLRAWRVDHAWRVNRRPDTRAGVLGASQMVGAMEDAWDALRATGAGMPRTALFVTGPSRTGDIEVTLYLGAHGPRRLHVILVDGGGEAGGMAVERLGGS